ncbi:O-antigen ligase family protein [Halorussus salinisoli]|uniref:O-antigen ligase family protein n=1 Tax=Halorussus salinisoli TaxID=2558242 RepID=UPI0010C1F030|nr:O-antigen ligase family protein [Halorussus salinisoli]
MRVQQSDEFVGVRSTISWLLALGLFTAIILQNTLLTTSFAYVVTAVVYIGIVLSFLVLSDAVLSAQRVYVLLFLLFASVASLRTILDPSVVSTVRVAALLTFTTANLFILPRSISFRHFCFVASRLSAVLVLLGFLPYIGLPLRIGFIDLSLWGADLYWYPELPPMTSVFVNPNQLGSFALVGVITALAEWRIHKTTLPKLIFGINVAGLLFSNYRTGWAALVAALGLFVVYSIWGRKQLVLATTGGLSLLALILMMLFNLAPGPEALTEFSLNGRRELWTASAHALKDQYVWGYNFRGVTQIVGNPHNSYLRMFVAFGVSGGFLYLLLVLGTTIGSARQATTHYGLLHVMLLVAFAIIQVNNGLTFVGVSMRSTLIAISMGYYITDESPRF